MAVNRQVMRILEQVSSLSPEGRRNYHDAYMLMKEMNAKYDGHNNNSDMDSMKPKKKQRKQIKRISPLKKTLQNTGIILLLLISYIVAGSVTYPY